MAGPSNNDELGAFLASQPDDGDDELGAFLKTSNLAGVLPQPAQPPPVAAIPAAAPAAKPSLLDRLRAKLAPYSPAPVTDEAARITPPPDRLAAAREFAQGAGQVGEGLLEFGADVATGGAAGRTPARVIAQGNALADQLSKIKAAYQATDVPRPLAVGEAVARTAAIPLEQFGLPVTQMGEDIGAGRYARAAGTAAATAAMFGAGHVLHGGEAPPDAGIYTPEAAGEAPAGIYTKPPVDELGAFLSTGSVAPEGGANTPISTPRPTPPPVLDESGRDLGGYAGPERRGSHPPFLPEGIDERRSTDAVDQIRRKLAEGEPLGTLERRRDFEERQRVEDARAQAAAERESPAPPTGRGPSVTFTSGMELFSLDELEAMLNSKNPENQAKAVAEMRRRAAEGKPADVPRGMDQPDELEAFVQQQEEPHATPTGEQPPDDQLEHLGANPLRNETAQPEADHRDRALGGAPDGGQESPVRPPAEDRAAVTPQPGESFREFYLRSGLTMQEAAHAMQAYVRGHGEMPAEQAPERPVEQPPEQPPKPSALPKPKKGQSIWSTLDADHRQAFKAGLGGFSGSENRWQELRLRGATDEQILAQAGSEFGIDGSSSGPGKIGYRHKGGKTPTLILNEFSPEKVTIKGPQLVATIREALGIGEPVRTLGGKPIAERPVGMHEFSEAKAKDLLAPFELAAPHGGYNDAELAAFTDQLSDAAAKLVQRKGRAAAAPLRAMVEAIERGRTSKTRDIFPWEHDPYEEALPNLERALRGAEGQQELDVQPPEVPPSGSGPSIEAPKPEVAEEPPASDNAFAQQFKLVKSRKVGGGAKTTTADETTWQGTYDGLNLTLRVRPRAVSEGEHFLTSANQRIRESNVGKFGHFLDVEVLDGGPLTDAQRDALGKFISAADGQKRAARVRERGEPFRTGQLSGTPDRMQRPPEGASPEEPPPAPLGLKRKKGKESLAVPEPAAAPLSAEESDLILKARSYGNRLVWRWVKQDKPAKEGGGTLDERWEPAAGTPVEIPGGEGHEFAVHKTNGGKWVVTERRTGLAVSKELKSRADAIANAEAAVGLYGKEKLAAKVEEEAAKRPPYPEIRAAGEKAKPSAIPKPKVDSAVTAAAHVREGMTRRLELGGVTDAKAVKAGILDILQKELEDVRADYEADSERRSHVVERPYHGPNPAEPMGPHLGPTFTVDVPGDGQFTIGRDVESIENAIERIGGAHPNVWKDVVQGPPKKPSALPKPAESWSEQFNDRSRIDYDRARNKYTITRDGQQLADTFYDRDAARTYLRELGDKAAPAAKGKKGKKPSALPPPKPLEGEPAPKPNAVEALKGGKEPIYFRSGIKHAAADFDGLANANVPIGVTAHGMTSKIEARVTDYLRQGGQVFVDSGAFGNPKVDFDAVMDKYARIADATQTFGERDNLYVVAPDVVGDQAASVELRNRYHKELDALIEDGVHVIVPLQKGGTPLALELRSLVDQFGENVVAGIPFNKAAFTKAELVSALGELQGKGIPDIHLLGIGENAKAYADVMAAIRAVVPKSVELSSDSNRVAALMGEGRPTTTAIREGVEDNAPQRVDYDPEADTTELTGQIYGGHFDAFAPKELQQIADSLNVSVEQLREWERGDVLPDQIADTGLEQNLDNALNAIAQQRARKMEGPVQRTKAITESEKPVPVDVMKKARGIARREWQTDEKKLEAITRLGIDEATARDLIDKAYERGGSGNARTAPRERGGTTLQATVVPGAKEFLEQDVVPTVKAAGEKVAAAADDIQRAFAVDTRGEAAGVTGGIIRARGAEFAHRTERAQAALEGARKALDKLPNNTNLGLIDDIEHGRTPTQPELQPIAKALRQLLDGRRREVQQRGRLQQAIENYFPHIWKDPNAAKEWMRGLFGKKPLQGPKHFLKKRSIEYTADGIKPVSQGGPGLEPVSYNPVTLALLKVREMDKWITGHDALEDMKAAGVAKYVPVGVEAPEGWTKINDPIGTVYGNPNVPVHEAVDASVWQGLHQVADALGVRHERNVKVKGGPRGAWGLSHQGANRVQTRFGGSESILAHEIGHQIDHKFGLWNKLKDLEQQYKAQGYEDWNLNKQLRAVTDLTWEGMDPARVADSFKQYVRKKEEKIANMIEAYVHAPDKFKKAAPDVFNVLDELVDTTPQLQGLRDIKPGIRLHARTDTTRVGGMVTNGFWYSPAEAAQVLNQHLSPGLAGNALFDVYRAAGNTVTQAKFALSGFHAVVESVNSVLSKAALAMQEATPQRLGGFGLPKQALKHTGEIVVAPIVDYFRGGKARAEYLAKGLTGDPTTSIADRIVQGGGRVKWDDFYHSNMSEAFMTALRQKNPIGAAIRAPFALNEQLGARAIMGHLVPRLKLGAYLDLAQAEMSRLPKDASQADVQRVLGRAWDSIDNRFGELVYDNLFWPKWIKDVGQVSTRALGWNVGTVRELGGAAVDTGKYVNDLARGRTPHLSSRMAYATSLGVIGTAFAGAMINKLYTGQNPRDVKDLIFPRTGRLTPDGHEERIKLPTYAADTYEFAHDPQQTVANKMSDLTTALIELAENKDRRNVQIRNPDAGVGEQLGQTGKYLARKFEPISVSNARRASEDGRSPVSGFLGLSQAPASVGRSKAEQLIYDYTRSEDTRTLEEEGRREQRQALRNDLKAGDRSDARELARSGTLGRRSILQTAKGAQLNALQAGFKRLTADQALKVYEAATPEERGALRPLLSTKLQRTLRDAPRNDLPAYKERVNRARGLPFTKPALALQPQAGP
jgi:hypothetical protein